RLFIAGNGKLNMTAKPRNISQTILGNGEIQQMSQEAARQALGAIDAGRFASDAAETAIQSTLGNGRIGEIASEAARRGIENAQIERHVREGIERGMARMDRDLNREMDHGSTQSDDSITVRDHRDINIGHVEQKKLKVTILASGSVSADGKVDEL